MMSELMNVSVLAVCSVVASCDHSGRCSDI